MRRLGILGLLLTVALEPGTLLAQQATTLMPTLANAQLPLYPHVIRAARIQGDVVVRVSTDGQRASGVKVESGPPMLAEATRNNVKTWRFEPHTPTSFTVTFHYKLLLPTKCDSECDCDSEEKESVLVQLPTVDLSAKIPGICDLPERVESKR